jgi:hypothetical protein
MTRGAFSAAEVPFDPALQTTPRTLASGDLAVEGDIQHGGVLNGGPPENIAAASLLQVKLE